MSSIGIFPLKYFALNLIRVGYPRGHRCDSSFFGGWIMSGPLPSALRALIRKFMEEELNGRRRCI